MVPGTLVDGLVWDAADYDSGKSLAGSRDAEKGPFPASAAALLEGGEQGRL